MVRPSALAVLSFMRKSNFVGCIIGRSTAFSPLRMNLLPTVLDYCAFVGASGRTAATPSGLMLKAKKVKGSPPGFPH